MEVAESGERLACAMKDGLLHTSMRWRTAKVYAERAIKQSITAMMPNKIVEVIGN